jgi:hypothetical protein
MVLQILLRQIDLESFIMVAARSIILAIIFPAATSSIMVIRALGSPATSTRLFGYFFLVYWCWYPLPMAIDYFNGYARACSLDMRL